MTSLRAALLTTLLAASPVATSGTAHAQPSSEPAPHETMPTDRPDDDAPDLTQRSGLRAEPIAIGADGWDRTDEDVPGEWQRTTTLRRGGATVVIDRWWGMPTTDGGPMSIASRRAVVIDGVDTEVLRADAFEGHADDVDVVFLRGAGWLVRIVLRDCTPQDEQDLFAGLTIPGPR